MEKQIILRKPHGSIKKHLVMKRYFIQRINSINNDILLDTFKIKGSLATTHFSIITSKVTMSINTNNKNTFRTKSNLHNSQK